jgi:hypothetical protein
MAKSDTPPGAERHQIDIVVNGTPTTVPIHGNPSLSELVELALALSNNTGQPASQWELRGPDSAPLLDLTLKIKNMHLAVDAVLYLNLRAGVGGSR